MSYRRFLTNLAIVILVAAVYFGAAKLGLALAFVNASASAVWPPTGVAIAALLLLGPRAWLGVFIGAFIANLTTSGTVVTSLAIAAGNTLEGVAGAWLARRYANGLEAFTRTADVFRFVLLAGLLAPIISATIGVSSLGLGGLMPWGAFGAVWLTWWLGDVVGAVVVAPFVMLWGRRQDWRALIPRAAPGDRRWLEAALLLLTLLLVGRIVFGAANNASLEFTCIPVLIWAAFRFGPRAAATIALLLSVIAIWGTLHAQGPFYRGTPNESLLVLQAFIGVTVAMSLILAAAVAERARVEEALRESEQRFRATFDQAAVGIAHVAPSGSWLQVNQRLCEMVGYPREELLQRTFQDITHPNDLDTDLAYVGQMLANEIPTYSMEKRYIRKDGSLVWINLTVSLVREASGAPKYFISVVEDITVRKRAEETRRDSEELYRLITENTGDMIMLLDQLGRFTYISPSCRQVLGYDPAELIGTSGFDLVHPEDLASVLEQRPQLASSGATQLTCRYRHADGAWRWLEARGTVVMRPGSRYTVAVGRDVTERKCAEEMLRESKAQTEAILQGVSDGVTVQDRTGRLVYANDLAAQMSGYASAPAFLEAPLAEALQQFDILDAAGHPFPLEHLPGRLALQGLPSSEALVRFRIRATGEERWSVVKATAIYDESGQAQLAITTFHDITMHKQAEAALRQSEERFAKAFRASPVAMAITRVSDNCFIDVNERFYRMLDYSPEEVLGRSSLDLNLLADPEDRAARVRIQRERGSVRDYETIVRSKAGELRAALLSVEAIELAGEPCFLTILVDISDRKRAEQALRRTADRLRYLREIDQAILASRPLIEIAQAAVGHLWELLACTRVSVVQADMLARTITLFATHVKGELRVPVGLQAPLEVLGEALAPLMRGQIYQVPDLAELPELPAALRVARVEHVRGYCYVPIIADTELIGVLGLGSDAPGLFSVEHLDIAREAADQLSIAMRQARLQDQIQRHAAELEQRVVERTAELQVALGRMEALYSVTRTAIASEHWPVAMQQVVDRVATAIPANRVALIIFDQYERRMPHFIGGGPGREHVVATVSFDELLDGLTGWVIREGRSARSPKGAPDPRESAAVQQRRAETNCGAIAVVPLRYQDQVLGTMTVINRPEERDFSEADIELIEAIAGQVVIAHVRASLYKRLQHAMARLASILDIADDAIIAMNGRQEIELFNQGAERIFGYTAQEVIGQPVDMLLPERFTATHSQHIAAFASSAAVARRMGERRDLFGRRRDGAEFPVEASISKLIINNEPVFTVILRDITARKCAEDALKTFATKLEHRNRELQEFASVASHDLQEPLRKIQAFSDLLKTEYAATLDVEGRDYLERMQNAAARMQTLINDLLMLARLGSEARPFVAVDLNRVAREVLDDLDTRIVRTSAHVELGDLPTIEADPLQMRQLLQNVIGNALKFGRPEEPPIVKIQSHLIAGAESRLAVSATGGSCCRISVEDNGIGIDEKYLDRIFAVFQRLHGRGTYEGTGIGLAVCRRITERHGGSITATSILGQGTTFIITLPVNQVSGRNSS